MPMSIEFFEKDGRGFNPKASVRQQGQIGLNQAAIDKFNIQNNQNVLLGYDKDLKMVVIKPLAVAQEGSKKVVVRDRSGSISARGFFDYFEIPHEKTKSYPLEENNDNHYLFFYLDSGMKAQGSKTED